VGRNAVRTIAPALYLIPSLLGEIPVEQVLPQYNRDLIIGIRHFIVEDVRTARRFLKQVEGSIDIDLAPPLIKSNRQVLGRHLKTLYPELRGVSYSLLAQTAW
jgi:16S rRNA (cytidine1402-2'-O)-methyltransferase